LRGILVLHGVCNTEKKYRMLREGLMEEAQRSRPEKVKYVLGVERGIEISQQ